MNQSSFERQHAADWERFEQWLRQTKQSKAASGLDAAEIPHLYRRLCNDLALARQRCYSPALIERLHDLVLRGHQQLYGAGAGLWPRIVVFAAAGFPRLVRREWRLCLIAGLLFYLPFLFMFAGAVIFPDLVLTVMSQEALAELEFMYSPAAESLGRLRQADTDLMMFGYYIKNNIGIAFQTFAGGIAYGLGTIFYLIYNGLYIGAVFGHLSHIGYGERLYPFVAGHSSLELTAVVLAGAAGLKLGLALVRPGRLRRVDALKAAAQVSVRIVYGASAMLLAAAFVEAFWSSSTTLPVQAKYAAGLCGWLLLAVYFLLAGRRHAD